MNVNNNGLILSQQTLVLMKTSWRCLLSSSLEDVFKTSWSRQIYLSYSCVFRRRLQDVLIKTNIFVLVVCLEDVFKTFSRRLQDVLPGRLEDVLKMSSRYLAKTSSRHLQDVLARRLQDIFKTSSRHLAKMTFSRRIIRLNCLPRSRICSGHAFEKLMVSVKNLQMW